MAQYKTFPCKWCKKLIHWGQDPTTDKFVAYDEHGDNHRCTKRVRLEYGKNRPKEALGDDFGLGGIEGKGKSLPRVPESSPGAGPGPDWKLLSTIGVGPYTETRAWPDALAKILVRLTDVEERLDGLEHQ